MPVLQRLRLCAPQFGDRHPSHPTPTPRREGLDQECGKDDVRGRTKERIRRGRIVTVLMVRARDDPGVKHNRPTEGKNLKRVSMFELCA
jgi:hypothetical protein